MRKWLTSTALILAMGVAFGAQAQDLTDSELAQQILDDLREANENAEATNTLGRVIERSYAQLRFLDRLNGKVEIIELGIGESQKHQYLTISLDSCFVPSDNTASDAIAFIHVDDEREDQPDFNGWMIASSPALNAMEHPRYDVWVISCSEEPSISKLVNPDVPPARPDDLPDPATLESIE